MSIRNATSLALSLMLAATSQAGDRIFVSLEGVIEVYDFDTGQELPGSPITMSAEITDMERSQGGSVVHAVDANGQRVRIDTRTLNTVTAPQALPFGNHDIALDGLRWRIHSVDQTMILRSQDAYLSGPVTTTNLRVQDRLNAVVMTPNGHKGYVWDEPTMDFLEFDPVTLSATALWSNGTDMTEMAASPNNRHIVLAGTVTRHGQPLGSVVPTVWAKVFDRWTGEVIYKVKYDSQLAPGRPRGIAFDHTAPERFWIGTEEGVQPLTIGSVVLGTKTYRWLDKHPSKIGAPDVRDLAWNVGANLYVLYSDEVVRYQSGVNLNGSFSFPVEADRTNLVVVPELGAPKEVFQLLSPEWLGLLKVVAVKQWKLPMGWNIDGGQVQEEDCDPWAVIMAAKRANAWLESLEDKDHTLEPGQVAEFLAQAKGADPQTAEQFLDLVFLEAEEESQ